MSEALHLDATPAKQLSAELLTRTHIHAEMVRRLIAETESAPIELGEVLEDIANTYLDIADEIIDLARTRRGLER